MSEFTINAKQLVLDWMGSNAFTPVNKAAAKKIGYKEAGLLGEAVNQYKRWHADNKLDQNGWFYWTEDSCEEETTFPKSTQHRLFEKLEKEGCLKRHKKKIHPDHMKTTRFIELNFTAIAAVMLEPEEAKEQRMEMRKERKEKRKSYNQNYKENRKSQNETSETKKPESIGTTGKSQNETSRKTQNETSSKSQNGALSKKELVIKKEKIIKKEFKKSLSITDHINQMDIPTEAKEILKGQTDRLKIYNLATIRKHYEKSGLPEERMNQVLQRVFENDFENFTGYLNKAVEDEIHRKEQPQRPRSASAPGIKIPEWLKPTTQEVAAAAEEPKYTEEENKEWLEGLIAEMNKDLKKEAGN